MPETRNLTPEEFLRQMDEMPGWRARTLRGHERPEDLENLDSMALVLPIVLAATANNANISSYQVVGCSTVTRLLGSARVS